MWLGEGGEKSAGLNGDDSVPETHLSHHLVCGRLYAQIGDTDLDGRPDNTTTKWHSCGL